MAAGTHTFAALLRGINVGRRNQISMAALRTSLTASGLEDVGTYIQSGNVVFRTSERDAAKVAAAVADTIAREFDLRLAVILRTHDELTAVAAASPFSSGDADRKRLHVVFLDAVPPAEAVTELDPERSPPDRFAVQDREIYLDLPNGAGRSKLSLDWFERRLGVRGTARNWNTLLELIERTRP